MKPYIAIKTLLRSPVKTLVTFLLLIATSFAFVSRGVEYASTVRQINAAESQYSAIGTVEKSLQGYYDWMTTTVGEEVSELENGLYLERIDKAIVPLENEAIDIVNSSEYVADSVVIKVSGGVSDNTLSNVVEQPLSEVPEYSSWLWFWTEGTFDIDSIFVLARRVPKTENIFEIEELLACADDSIARVGMQVQVFHDNRSINNGVFGEQMGKDTDLFFLALTTYFDNEKQIMKKLNPYIDCPVVNISKLEREHATNDYIEALNDPKKFGILQIESSELSLVPTTEYLETVNRNNHTQEVVYVPQMNAIHKFWSGDMYILEGRELAEGDGNVCVIGSNYAARNGLSVGDSITLNLCADTMVHSGKVFGREPPYPVVKAESIGNESVVRQQIVTLGCEQKLTERGLPNVTKTFEIVGIWSDVDFDVEDPYTYALNTIFVPDSCYPWQGEVEPSALPSTFSFRLNDPGDVAAIEAELSDKLALLGYELSINDGGYAAAKPNLDFMKLTALIGFIGMSLALLLALILITYLFIIRKKKDYAIMRALGTTRGRSNR